SDAHWPTRGATESAPIRAAIGTTPRQDCPGIAARKRIRGSRPRFAGGMTLAPSAEPRVSASEHRGGARGAFTNLHARSKHPMERLSRRQILQLLSVSVAAGACGANSDVDSFSDTDAEALSDKEMLHEIDHFVILMQENRTFDHYLGALKRDSKYPNN